MKPLEVFEKISLSKTFHIGMILALGALLVLDVFQTSVVSATGSDISFLQKQIRELKQENERLDFEIAQYRSMDNIQSRLANMNLVYGGTPTYVTLLGSSVAVK